MNNFENGRVERTKTIILCRPLKDVFPMFQPEGEKSWTSNWNPQYVWPRDGLPHEGLVFTHDNGQGGESIWTLTRFDQDNHRIEYTVVAPGSHVSQIRIRCEQTESGETSARISYTVTPISEEGLSVLENFAQQDYEHRISTWKKAMDHFFSTGQPSDVR